jgi:hypothetical protein
MAEEAPRAVLERVEAQEAVLLDRAGGEHDAAEQRDVEDALADLVALQRVHRQVEEREQHELLDAAVGGQGVGSEGGREDRPHREGQERPVERQALQAGGAADEPREVDGGREQDLRGEDRDQARRRQGGHEPALRALEAPRLGQEASTVASSGSMIGMSSRTG